MLLIMEGHVLYSYNLLALIVLFGTSLSQATSLLDYYEAHVVSNLDVRPKMAKQWEGIQVTTCPSEDGVFENTEDCSNYFSHLCKFIGSNESICSEEYNKICLSAISSICEERSKVTTNEPITTTREPTTTEKVTTVEEITVLTSPRTTMTTSRPTTSPEPTTQKPTGPPETSCDDGDLDCIIDDTGVTPDWFNCPEDIGSYPHPLSNKLFIFCLNWKPSVKKCGKNLVYSIKLRTCVNPGAEYAYNVFLNLKAI